MRILGFNDMIQQYFNGAVRQQLQHRAGQLGLKGQEAIDVISTTKNTIKEILQTELSNGQYNEVLTFLKNAGLKTGKQIFFDKIIQRVVGRLMVRFGLPQTVALSLAMLLVPFIIKRIGNKALKSGKVKDLLQAIGITDQVEKLNILKTQVKDKFTSKSQAA